MEIGPYSLPPLASVPANGVLRVGGSTPCGADAAPGHRLFRPRFVEVVDASKTFRKGGPYLPLVPLASTTQTNFVSGAGVPTPCGAVQSRGSLFL